MAMDIKSLRQLVDWAAQAPEGTTLPAQVVATLGGQFLESDQRHREAEAPPVDPPDWTWRERIWTVPAETRIGVQELAEALGRSSSWIYKRTGEAAEDRRLPHRKLDGELLFAVGEIRTWLRDREETHHAVPMTSASSERLAVVR